MHLTLKKDHQTGSRQLPAAASPLRQVHRDLQPPAPARSLGHEISRRSLPTFAPSLYRVAGHRLSLPRQNHCGHSLRPHLFGKQGNQFQPGLCRTAVGMKEVHDDIWLVSFMDYDLGYFDLLTRVLEPLENPFGPKVLPM